MPYIIHDIENDAYLSGIKEYKKKDGTPYINSYWLGFLDWASNIVVDVMTFRTKSEANKVKKALVKEATIFVDDDKKTIAQYFRIMKCSPKIMQAVQIDETDD